MLLPVPDDASLVHCRLNSSVDDVGAVRNDKIAIRAAPIPHAGRNGVLRLDLVVKFIRDETGVLATGDHAFATVVSGNVGGMAVNFDRRSDMR